MRSFFGNAPDYDRDWGEEYDDVYDRDGEVILTECCNQPMKFDGTDYICPECGETIDRDDFLDNYCEPFGSECYSCRTNFPRCGVCHRNHQEELDEWDELYG